MVKPGYKQTEVGVIPEDWDVDKIKNLASITTGSRNTQDKKHNGKYPFFVRSQTAERIDTFSFNGEAVLTAGDGVGTGKVFHYINGKFDYHQRVYKISNFKTELDGYYFYKYFSSFFYHRIVSMTAKSSVDSVRMEMISDMLVPLPKPDEQCAIANALSDVDALITALDKLIVKKRAIKTAAMQQLLTGKKRLPGFGDGKGYKHTEVGLIPEDWNTPKIGELFEFKNGLNKAKEFFGTGTPIVNYMDVFENPGLCKKVIKGKVNVSKEELKAYNVKKGDVFFTRTSETVDEIGVTSVMLEDIENAVFSGFVLRARPKTDLLVLPFKQYCFSSNIVRKQITSKSTYTTRALTNGRFLSQVAFPCPKESIEQEAIAAVLRDMDDEIAALEARRDKTRAVKQGMMQELLTGRTRLI